MKEGLLIYGTIAIDTLITPKGTAESVLGGSGPYAALAGRFLAPDLQLFGIIGSDFPPAFRQALEGVGISLCHVQEQTGRTFAWTGQYAEDMNNRETVETVEGVQDQWIPRLAEELRHPRILLSCNVRPDLQWQVIEQCHPESLLLADFMKTWIEREPDYVAKILARADIALMNDEEARYYAQSDSLDEAGRAILQAGAHYAIIKQGSEGAILYSYTPDGQLHRHNCPAHHIDNVCDPTGAGDSLMGALGSYLNHHKANRPISWDDVKAGLHYATIIAAKACQSFGTSSLLQMHAEDAKMIKEK